ncbi:hypothetical protein AVEN_211395-1 [Araneus ventricosus]|uniref:Uncharacterized protein n=1 Tax=Araneus ventricosus TaxID=182803 RepID=A0A4Y2MY53_ARAVE|nr:hypothetical protein AVEN_211395-1 [Araneus ventricosus]
MDIDFVQDLQKKSYGDNAIGCVQMKKDVDLCTVKGRITPEHRVRKTAYPFATVCNESEDAILLCVKCSGFAASQAGV